MPREDRLLGSRVITVENNELLSSQRHVQLVELKIGDALIRGPFSRSYQEIAWFLRSSLPLNPVDISRIIEEIDAGSRGHAKSSWKDEHPICFTTIHTGQNRLPSYQVHRVVPRCRDCVCLDDQKSFPELADSRSIRYTVYFNDKNGRPQRRRWRTRLRFSARFEDIIATSQERARAMATWLQRIWCWKT